jgi:hypothetical protein
MHNAFLYVIGMEPTVKINYYTIFLARDQMIAEKILDYLVI